MNVSFFFGIKKSALFFDIGKKSILLKDLSYYSIIKLKLLNFKVKDKINSEALFYSIADRIPLV